MLPRTLEPEVMDTPAEARDYDAMDHAEVNRRFVTDFLAAALNQERDVPADMLDVGTGTALIPIELCRQTAGCQVTAVDLADAMLKLARENVIATGFGERIMLERIDAKKLPYADGQFSAVLSNSIIHHIPEPLTVLREMLRVLAPGGLLFVRDLLRPASLPVVEELVATYAGHENAHSRAMFRNSLYAALTLDEVRDLLVECNAPPAWVTQTSDRHWTIAGRK